MGINRLKTLINFYLLDKKKEDYYLKYNSKLGSGQFSK